MLVPQLCPSLCDPMDCSPLGSSVHGILQARILKWGAIPLSRGSSWPRDQTTSFSPFSILTPLIIWKLPIAHNHVVRIICPQQHCLSEIIHPGLKCLRKLWPVGSLSRNLECDLSNWSLEWRLDFRLREKGWEKQSWKDRESLQFSSAAQLCPTLCNPMDPSTPGLPVHHQLPEFTQTHVHWVGDAI